jgi:hypothetical protein
MAVLELDAEHGIREKLHDAAAHLEQFFFGQKFSLQWVRKVAAPYRGAAEK